MIQEILKEAKILCNRCGASKDICGKGGVKCFVYGRGYKRHSFRDIGKNEVLVHKDYAEIIVHSRGKDVSVKVDIDDLEEVMSHKWHITGKEKYPYVGTKPLGMKETNLSLHHLVFGKPPEGKVTDHINGDSLDNRKENLRFCTANENWVNRGHSSHNTSGYKGVVSRGERWVAQIKHRKKAFYLGAFDTKEEAAIAYNKKATELHGKFAKLNIIN